MRKFAVSLAFGIRVNLFLSRGGQETIARRFGEAPHKHVPLLRDEALSFTNDASLDVS